MKIPENAIIPAKLTRYLLVVRPRNDKSKFLAQAGLPPKILKPYFPKYVNLCDRMMHWKIEPMNMEPTIKSKACCRVANEINP